jgi:hypothetical protein
MYLYMIQFLDSLTLVCVCSGETSTNPWVQLIYKILIFEDRNMDEVELVLEDIFQHNISPTVSNCYLSTSL